MFRMGVQTYRGPTHFNYVYHKDPMKVRRSYRLRRYPAFPPLISHLWDA
jgi:hypothetical protein